MTIKHHHPKILLFAFVFVVIGWGIVTKNKLNHDKINCDHYRPVSNGLQRTSAAKYRDSVPEGSKD